MSAKKKRKKYCKTCPISIADKAPQAVYCDVCMAKRDKERKQKEYLDNRDERLQKAKAYYQENKEDIKKKTRQYRLDNRSKILLKQKERYQRNKDHYKKQSSKHYYENTAYYKEYNKQYRSNPINKERRNRNYREKVENDPSFLEKRRIRGRIKRTKILDSLIEDQNNLCGICGEPMPDDYGLIHIDHILPVSKGGGNDRDNLQAAHAVCNIRKGNKT